MVAHAQRGEVRAVAADGTEESTLDVNQRHALEFDDSYDREDAQALSSRLREVSLLKDESADCVTSGVTPFLADEAGY